MDRLTGPLLETVVKDYTSGKDVNMQQLAFGLKELFDELDRSRCFHGDLQTHNIIVDMDSRGNIGNVQAIDFGNSLLGKTKPNMNVLEFLSGITDDERLKALIPYLRATGLKIPQNILEWSDPDYEAHTFMGQQNYIIEEMKFDPKVDIDDLIDH